MFDGWGLRKINLVSECSNFRVIVRFSVKKSSGTLHRSIYEYQQRKRLNDKTTVCKKWQGRMRKQDSIQERTFDNSLDDRYSIKERRTTEYILKSFEFW